MTDADMQFLTAYATVMKPIVLAMNLLQGETTTYIGNVIPTIMGVKSKLEQTRDRAVEPLVSALSAGILRSVIYWRRQGRPGIADKLWSQLLLAAI